jgi:hypothetical protein
MSTGDVPRDRITVGVSTIGEDCLELLVSRRWFDSDVVAFRVALAYALAAGLEPSKGVSYTTKWNAGTLDPDKRVQDLVQTFTSSARPYETAQALGDAGLRRIAERVRNSEGLSEILSSPG